MSFKLIKTIFENPGCAEGSSWSLLMAMANRADDDGNGVYASLPALAEDCGISERTAWRALKPLLESGVVVNTGEFKYWDKGHHTNIFKIEQSVILTLGKAQSANITAGCQIGRSRVSKLSSQSVKVACKPILKPILDPAPELASSLVSSVAAKTAATTSSPSSKPKQQAYSEEAMTQVWETLMDSFKSDIPESDVVAVMEAFAITVGDPEHPELICPWITGCLKWAFSHKKFWASRVVSAKAFAKHLSNTAENGLPAQYERIKEVLDRKDARPAYEKDKGHWNLGEDSQ